MIFQRLTVSPEDSSINDAASSIELPPVNVNFAINAPNYLGGTRESCRFPGAFWVRSAKILIRLYSGTCDCG